MRHALPEAPDPKGLALRAVPLVAALGNPVCGDDGAGALVVRLLAALGLAEEARLERVADPLALLDLWAPGDDVVLVDAARAPFPPGTHLELDAGRRKLPGGVHPVSSHGMGLAEAVALARQLGRMPRSLIVHAVVGTEFDQGAPMSEPVCRAAERLAHALFEELAARAGRPSGVWGQASVGASRGESDAA